VSVPTTQAINGEIKPGDWVISVPDVDYGCLVGQVIEVTPLGSPEHGLLTPCSGKANFWQ